MSKFVLIAVPTTTRRTKRSPKGSPKVVSRNLADLLPVKGAELFRTMREVSGMTNQEIAKAAGYRRKWAAVEMSLIATGRRVPIGQLKSKLTQLGFWR